MQQEGTVRIEDVPLQLYTEDKLAKLYRRCAERGSPAPASHCPSI
jgi:hypothetical protein